MIYTAVYRLPHALRALLRPLAHRVCAVSGHVRVRKGYRLSSCVCGARWRWR